jgi:putative ubiquitin-RnfH superfamily antitoxin RatB of RatAB toxin-antitoxin module
MRSPSESAMSLIMDVEVIYGEPSGVSRVVLTLDEGATVADAVQGLKQRRDCDSWQFEHASVGIFGEVKPLDWVVAAGDRLEIYLPLQLDPKEARRLRAKNQRVNR